MSDSKIPVFIAGLLCLVLILMISQKVYAKADKISEIGRSQYIYYKPAEKNIMRIWIAYVGQGDGILIQLPKKYTPESCKVDGVIDINVDGGNNKRYGKFLDRVYADYDSYMIDYNIITHFDSDHFQGLTELLSKDNVYFGRFYHNGLAWYKNGVWFTGSDDSITNKNRLMAYYEDGNIIDTFLVKNMSEAESYVDNKFTDSYKEFIDNLIYKNDTCNEEEIFSRTFHTSSHNHDLENRINAISPDLKLTILWPSETLHNYEGNSWSKTINGNSVTFLLQYKDFEMLFTGDHNNYSEDKMLNFLRSNDNEELLECDVLKVPHHGAGEEHASVDLFTASKLKPIISVASMGSLGFKSKWIPDKKKGWQHPSDSLIRCLGGANRFYSTFVHEKTFFWTDINSIDKQDKLIEASHILIETDGVRFRIVEIDTLGSGPITIPSPYDVDKGDGTKWILSYKN